MSAFGLSELIDVSIDAGARHARAQQPDERVGSQEQPRAADPTDSCQSRPASGVRSLRADFRGHSRRPRRSAGEHSGGRLDWPGHHAAAAHARAPHHRPSRVTGVSDTPSRRRIFTCRPTSSDEVLRRSGHHHGPRLRVPRAGQRRRSRLEAFYREDAQSTTSRVAFGSRCRRFSPARVLCFASKRRRRPFDPVRAIASATPIWRHVCRSSCGGPRPMPNC